MRPPRLMPALAIALVATVLIAWPSGSWMTAVRPSAVASRAVRKLTVAIVLLALVLGTVLVFLAFDRDSHSASDTIRPFIVTMAPVWIVTVWAARIVLRRV